MRNMNTKVQKDKRERRTRAKIKGTKERPRLSVFRSNRYLYAQLIDDETRHTLFGVSEKQLEKSSGNEKKTDRAKKLGLMLAKQAVSKRIKKVVFDRGRYAYHGKVKTLAEGAREGGLQF